jgi:hypothetical protein
MPQTCKACKHAERAAIDAALARNQSLRNIGKRFSISPAALFRHKRDHASVSIVKASEKRGLSIGSSLIGQFERLQQRVMMVMDRSERENDGHLSLKAVREYRENLAGIASLLKFGDPSRPKDEQQSDITIQVIDISAQPTRELCAEPALPRLPQ